MSKVLTAIFSLLFLSTTLSFASEERILNKSPRSMGMGGVGVSTFGYSFSPQANPASLGLMFDYTIVPIFELGFSMSPDAVDFGLALSKGFGDVSNTDFGSFDQYLGRSISSGLSSPLNLGFMGKGFGIWLSAGAEGNLSVFNTPESPLSGIKLNTLSQTITQVSNLIDTSGGISSANQSEIEEIFTSGMYQDLKNSGLSDSEIYGQINNLLNQIAGTSGTPVDFVDATGSVDVDKIKDNLTDGGTGTSLKIDEKALLSILPRIYARLYADIAVNIGYGYKIAFKGLDEQSGLSLGATLRFIQRFKSDSLNGEVTIDEAANHLDILQGFAVTSDFGVSLQLQNFILGFAIRDAFSTPFQWSSVINSTSGFRTTSSFSPSYDIGISYRFLFTNPWIQEIGFYVEGIDLASTYLMPIEKFRAGTEIKLFRFLDLRVGVYDGFVTAGLGMGGKWGRVDFSYYRESYRILDNLSVYGDRLSLSLAVMYENTPARKASAAARKALRQEQTANAEAAARDALEEASLRAI
ncbi:MAG: hypothetical protein ACRC9L_09810 [Brevinema sp.]